jgi:hypothetical protein
MKELKHNNKELLNEIIQIVSDYYEVDLYENTNRPSVSSPRMNAIYLIRKYTTNLTLEVIAKKFNRKHSNLSVMLKRLEESLPFDRQRKRELNELDLLIKTTSKYIQKTDKDKLIIQALNRLQAMNKIQLKHFLEESEDFLDKMLVEYEIIK